MRKRERKPKTVAALNFLASRGVLKKSFELGEKPPNPIDGELRRKTQGLIDRKTSLFNWRKTSEPY